MNLICTGKGELLHKLRDTDDESLDFAFIVTGALRDACGDFFNACLGESARALKNGGLLFVQGTPDHLSEIGVELERRLTFKYWIAVESEMRCARPGLPSVHSAVLLFSKGSAFNVKRTRIPHRQCEFCGKSLKDWGGKTHLMHPDGCVISDVWKHLPSADNYTGVSAPLLGAILSIMDSGESEPTGLIGPSEGLQASGVLTERHTLAGDSNGHTNDVPPELVDIIHQGDAVEVLRRYPDNSVDLVFADPPYNLKKPYSVCEDGWTEEQYIDWCNAWLDEYVRVLKPTGSLYVLNLPRWSMYHAEFLNKRLHLRNWIVWDALPDPRGKLLPAHYGLLFYTKSCDGFTFNYEDVGNVEGRQYCLRASCIRKRKASGADDKEPLTDIWSDIHRIRHRRDRDYHPCQLPDSLLERIILLSTNEDDIVLDALCGVGTTPVVAAGLGRRYVGIDIDENYVAITRRKLSELGLFGRVARQSTRKSQRVFTKKELQLELQNLAVKLGRLPTSEDVRDLSEYDLETFLEVFPTWSKALAAARIRRS